MARLGSIVVNGPARKIIAGTFFIDNAGVPAPPTVGEDFTVTRVAEGVYRLTLAEPVKSIITATAAPLSDTTVTETLMQVKTASALAGTVDFTTYIPATTGVKHPILWQKDLVDMSGPTVTPEVCFFCVPESGEIQSIRYCPSGPLIANDTKYATISVYSRDSSGGSQTLLGSADTTTTGTGDWTAFSPVIIPVSNPSILIGESFSIEITKTGSGVRVPEGSLVVCYQVGETNPVTARDFDSGIVHFSVLVETP